MQKDVIYIDVDDDITAIIGKVKDSQEKIVALVPPKRIGAIQSAVNLKLVHRAAEQVDKRLVIISNNAALMALAGSAGIPVAKNLQSKPEMAEIPALEVDDGEDIIDGSSLSNTSDSSVGVSDDTPTDIVPSEKIKASKKPAIGAAGALGAVAVAAKDKVKIPDFDSFRKKLFIGIVAAVLLIGVLVWAIVFAPSATVIVSARTSDSALNTQVTLSDSASTSLKDGTIKSVTKTSKKDISKSFTATGKKDAGTKAMGAVKFTPAGGSVYLNGATIPAGTVITATGGSQYMTDSTVVFDSDAPASSLAAGKSTGVTAVANGASYNGATGTASGPSGFATSFTTATSGGTDKTVTVVQQSDVDSVSSDLATQSDIEAAKKALKAQLGVDYIVLDASFKTDTGSVKPSPAVGAEASDGKGTLSGSVTFSLVAVARSEAKIFLDGYFAQQIDGKQNQKVYDNGATAASFTNVSPVDGGYKASISTNGKIGPKIDETALKEYAKGKRFGEIQDYVKQINGVEDVDVKFSPFWVTSAPNDTKKIQVEFKVNG